MRPRLPISAGRVGPRGEPDASHLCPVLSAAFDRSYRATTAWSAVDAATTELVRLRNAHYQGCHL